MTARKSVNSLAKIVLLTAFCLALSPFATNSQVCMDVDGDGDFDILDISYLNEYLFRSGPPPPDLSLANVDGFEKITLADFSYISGRHFAGFPLPSCSVLYPPIIPTHDSAILLSHTQWIDSGVTEAVITMEVSNNKTLTGIVLVFEMYLDDELIKPDSFRICFPGENENCGSIRINSLHDSLTVIHQLHIIFVMHPLYRFYLYTTVNPSSQRRPVSIEYTHASPPQANPPDSSLITMMVELFEFTPLPGDEWELNFNVWEPTITCCFQDRGDLNGDGDAGNVLDLTHLVDYIFRGSGDAGSCPDEADVNNDGDPATVLDLTTLIDYIFRGGPALPSCYF